MDNEEKAHAIDEYVRNRVAAVKRLRGSCKKFCH